MGKILWRTIPYTNGFYQVSNYGDVRFIPKENRIFNINNICNTLYLPVRIENKLRTYTDFSIEVPHIAIKTNYSNMFRPLSSIIYASFHGISNLSCDEVFHLDGNEHNNSLDNMILCDAKTKRRIVEKYYDSDSQSIRLDSNVFNLPSMRLISEYNINGVKQNLHLSLTSISKDLDLPLHRVANVVSAEKMLFYSDRIFKKGNGPYSIDTSLILKGDIHLSNTTSSLNNKFVFQYDIGGNLVRIYNNLYEATNNQKISIITLKNAITKKSLLNGNLWLLE